MIKLTMNDQNIQSNEKTIWVFKPIGWTPKTCINKCKEIIDYNSYQIPPKMSFAGRLDPMACGLLPIIINGKNNLTKEKIQNTYKTYQFNIILGFESDTYDILGMTNKRNNQINEITEEQLNKIKEIKIQTYPVYSSKCSFSDKYNKQVPLWKLAKEGLLPDVLPTRKIDIQNIQLFTTKTITNLELLEIVLTRINSLQDNNNNFRQNEIINNWKKLLLQQNTYTICHLEARVSVGTYIRSLANDLNGIVYDITRVSVDDKVLKDNIFDKFKFVYDV
jgi:tRNA U55 pseudouridine synthase TruB